MATKGLMRRLPLILAAAAHPAMPQQQPPPTTGTVPSSRCEGCAAAAILPFHIISKEFYCHPDGSKVDASCAAARTPESCCAACLKLNAEKRLCDAWFLNEQGGCFFKNCPPHAWASGECHFDPDVGTPGKYHSGIPDGQFCSGWGATFLWALLGAGVVYLGAGVAHNHRQGAALGMEALPHRQQWREVGALCQDGVAFARARLAGDRLAAGGAEGAREPLSVAEQAGSATLDEGEGYDEADVVE